MLPSGHPEQQQQQQQQQRQEDKLITKCKELMGPLKEKWSLTLKEAAHKINANGSAADSKMSVEQPQQGKFELHLEDFYATLDQVGWVFQLSEAFFPFFVLRHITSSLVYKGSFLKTN